MSEAGSPPASTNGAGSDPRRTLLARLIDDAGQFPPARKPYERALADHAQARGGAQGWVLGRFLCPASRLQPDVPEPVGVVSDGDDWEGDLDVAVSVGADAFELRDPGPGHYALLAAAPLAVFVEGAADLEALKAHGLRAKLRCGGADAAAFPSDFEVADFIAACRELDLPFKATAGLHHPLRTKDARLNILQHGFLNLLAAATVEVDDLARVIGDADPAAFAIGADGLAWRDQAVDAERARALFTAFGSCSFDEPIADLERLGAFEGARA